MDFDFTIDEFPHLVKAARELGQPISAYDLETNGFTHVPTFGIVEAAIIQIVPGMNGASMRVFSRIVNPGHPLDPEAALIHGKTEEMVRGQPEWGHFAAEFGSWLSVGMVSGYNSNWFDFPVLLQQNRRYGQGMQMPQGHNDVLWTLRTLMGASPGSLPVAAKNSGITVDGTKLHGALYDAYLCLRLLDTMVRDFGIDMVDCRQPNSILRDQFKALRHLLAVCSRVWASGYAGERDLAGNLGITVFEASTTMVNALRFSLLKPEIVLDASPIATFVRQNLPAAARSVGDQSRLKPVVEFLLRQQGAPTHIDYPVVQAGLMELLLN